MRQLFRSIHRWIVLKYIPDDHEVELADALFDIRHSR